MDPFEGTGQSEVSELSESPELTVSSEASDVPGPGDSTGETPTPSTGINPAWTGLRDAIGEDHFETFARPILQEMDQSAQRRITDLNAQLKSYEGYKSFVEGGVAPDQVQQAIQLAQMFEESPEQLYEFLTEHLGKGAPAEEPEEAPEPAFSIDDLPPEFQQQFAQMQAFQQQQQQLQEQQAYEADVARAEEQLQKEADDFLSANPTWTQEDLPELEEIRYRLSEQLRQQGHKRLASLDEAAKVLQERITRYASRGGSPAPHTLPTSAGGSVQAAGFDATKASKKDFNDQIVADLLGLKA